MNTTSERLRKFQSSEPSQWKQEAEARLANQDERRKARKVAIKMLNALETQGITESVLAERLGISLPELSSLLKGHKLPSASLMNSIASVLGITLTTLVPA